MKIKVLLLVLSIVAISLSAFADSQDDQWINMIDDAQLLLQNNRSQEAIEKFLNPVIQHFNSARSKNAEQIFCSRDGKETLVYLMQAAVTTLDEKDSPSYWGTRFSKHNKKGAVVWPQFWADAFYLKAFALINLGKISDAQKCLETAIGLSPVNSKYLAEYGYIHQIQKNWDMALQAYRAAGGESVIFSHPKIQEKEQARAWRGEGYVLIELGQLDDALKLYEKCLELDPDDKTAQTEVKYIKHLKNK